MSRNSSCDTRGKLRPAGWLALAAAVVVVAAAVCEALAFVLRFDPGEPVPVAEGENGTRAFTLRLRVRVGAAGAASFACCGSVLFFVTISFDLPKSCSGGGFGIVDKRVNRESKTRRQTVQEFKTLKAAMTE
jgi:hypothetical protein